ncbi:MAG: hypothetical protein R6V05_04620 [Candidatus Brocadiia bacterium]
MARAKLTYRRGAAASAWIALLAVCAALVWALCLGAYLWGARAADRASAAAGRAQLLAEAAEQLLAARAEGGGVEVRRMSRTEAASWAYWETVAERSGLPTDRFTIEPSFDEPEPGSGEPVLLSTQVTIEDAPLRQVLAFVHHITEERPYVSVSLLEADRESPTRWDATVETFLYFTEPAQPPSGPPAA